jgi:hypothetical protein
VVELVRHWYRELLKSQWSFFMTGQLGRSDIRRKHFARKRLAQAAKAIGEGAVEQVVTFVEDHFKANLDEPRLWDAFKTNDEEQWEAVRDELHQKADERLKRDIEKLERLEKESPGDWVALVFCANAEDKSRTVLISPNSELNAVLQASGEFEVVDMSWLRTLTLGQHFQHMGLLQAERRNGGWLFHLPEFSVETRAWEFLGRVTKTINRLLHANAGRESQLA